MINRILLVDWSINGFARYAEPLVNELRKNGYDGLINGLYFSGDEDEICTKMDSLISARKYGYDPVKILDELKPNMILLFAHRFCEYMYTIEAHRRNICVVNFQHGLYMDSTVISTISKDTIGKLLKRKKDQIRIYSKCIYYMNERKIIKTAKTFFDLIQYHSLYRVINDRFGSNCNADYSLVFGEYWKDYYKKQYKENATSFVIIGYPELEGKLRRADTLFSDDRPIGCYIAQTSVEDGLLSEQKLDQFLAVVERRLDSFNLVIKLHPRSNIELYKDLANKNNVKIWGFQEFPETDFYIGHESTVVARALYQTNKTMVCRLEYDRESPFEQYTSFVSKKNDEFDEVLNRLLESNKDIRIPTSLRDYVYKNENGAIKTAAEFITQILGVNGGKV